MSSQVHQAVIRFPEIRLNTRDAHKLRGYFGNLFQEYSPLLHNHLESGGSSYTYPLVQYKVLTGVPTLVGLNEGADLLIAMFLKIKEIIIDGNCYKVLEKNIESKMVELGISDDLHSYRFKTLWLALNQHNYLAYLNEDDERRMKHLKAILIGNLLSFFKGLNYRVEGMIMANLKVLNQKETQLKNNAMVAFDASFVSNVMLPNVIGLGKSVSRGFGTITLED